MTITTIPAVTLKSLATISPDRRRLALARFRGREARASVAQAIAARSGEIAVAEGLAQEVARYRIAIRALEMVEPAMVERADGEERAAQAIDLDLAA